MTSTNAGPPWGWRVRVCGGCRLPVARCRRSAFTLVELLTVLTIMVLLSALVAPAFIRQYHTARLNSAARSLVSLMRFAHSQAAVEGTTYRLNIDPNGRRLWVTYYDTRSEDAQAGFVLDRSVLGAERELPDSITITAIALGDEALQQLSDEAQSLLSAQHQSGNEEGTPYISFSPQGTTDGARIRLANEYQDELLVSLDAITGQATITEEVTENR